MINMNLTTVQQISVSILPILFAITVHEVAHGYIAYLLGDRTARILGRLTLNPIKHIDLIGTIIVPIVLFVLGGVVLGWAKPVPINTRNLNKPKRDMALIAVAGPSANFIMAIIWALFAKLALVLVNLNFSEVLVLYYMGMAGISINIMLMVINLLPIPQIDGGHIVSAMLPRSLSVYYDRLSPYGLLILMLLLLFGVLQKILVPVVSFLFASVVSMFGLL